MLTGIRLIHEIVTELRREAGPRQVANPRVGLVAQPCPVPFSSPQSLITSFGS
jgi:hypothetical protein